MAKTSNSTVSQVAKAVFKIFKTPGVTAVSKNEKFAGAILSAGKMSDKDRDELTRLVSSDPQAAIALLLDRLYGNGEAAAGAPVAHGSTITSYESDGELTGVFISANGVDPALRKRLRERLHHNPIATINELMNEILQ